MGVLPWSRASRCSLVAGETFRTAGHVIADQESGDECIREASLPSIPVSFTLTA